MSGGKDGQTLFHRILPATARGLTSTTAVDWHLKAKNKKCNVGLIKNYCITVSMQKISSIHKLIQQILGSHELNDHAHFWAGPPKNHWNNFLLSWICTTMQKISSFHQFIFEIQPILESCDQTGHTHPKNFWSTFNLYEFVSTCKKSGYFIDFSGDMVDKKSYNLIGWEHFGPYLRSQNFPKYGICAGIQQIW